MQISFTPETRLFRLTTSEMEYAFAVNSSGELINLHWGAPMHSDGHYALLLADSSIMSTLPRGYNSGE